MDGGGDVCAGLELAEQRVGDKVLGERAGVERDRVVGGGEAGEVEGGGGVERVQLDVGGGADQLD